MTLEVRENIFDKKRAEFWRFQSGKATSVFARLIQSSGRSKKMIEHAMKWIGACCIRRIVNGTDISDSSIVINLEVRDMTGSTTDLSKKLAPFCSIVCLLKCSGPEIIEQIKFQMIHN